MNSSPIVHARGWPSGSRLREVLAPLLGVLLLLAGALWGAGEYARAREELRRAETERYLAEFRQPAVADAWQRLHSVWQGERRRQQTLLARIARSSGGELEAALQNYRDFVLDTVEDERLVTEIASVQDFFSRLAVCIRVGNCDPALASAALGPVVWEFRSQHYDWFEREGLSEQVDRTVAAIAPQPPGKAPAELALRQAWSGGQEPPL
jgi:hypothetical protein